MIPPQLTRRPGIVGTLVAAALLTLSGAALAATQNAEERREGRDVKQDARQGARDTKQDCRADDQKSNADCRQDKRETKQDAREQKRDIKH